MLKKFFQAIAPGPKLIHVPVDCPPLQHYPGYLPEDRDLLLRYADAKAEVGESAYVDGFGVKTEFACVPFVTPAALNQERLQLPLPDDGFHAEGIEYVALLDSFCRRKVRGRFTAVEIGSGWGPGLVWLEYLLLGTALITCILLARRLRPSDTRSCAGILGGMA